MAAIKVTFTLDQSTISRLQDAASRLALPKSEIVREAINEFHERIGRLSQSERTRMLRALDEYISLPRQKSAAEVDREIAEVRSARRRGGRRSPVGANR